MGQKIDDLDAISGGIARPVIAIKFFKFSLLIFEHQHNIMYVLFPNMNKVARAWDIL